MYNNKINLMYEITYIEKAKAIIIREFLPEVNSSLFNKLTKTLFFQLRPWGTD